MRDSRGLRRRRCRLLIGLLRRSIGLPGDQQAESLDSSPPNDPAVAHHDWTAGDDPFAPLERLSRRFFEEAGGYSGLAILVQPHGSPTVIRVPVETPYLVIGRSEGCQLRLAAPVILPQHMLVFWLDGGLWWCDLASATNPPRCGFWKPGEAITLGGYRLTLASDRRMKVAPPSFPSPFIAIPSRAVTGLTLQLDPLNDTTPPRTIELNARLTLIGSGPQNRISLPKLGLSSVQTAILRTGSATWAIALSGATTVVNDRSVPFADLSPGDRLTLGSCEWEIAPVVQSASRDDEAPALMPDTATTTATKRQQLTAVEQELQAIERSITSGSVTDIQDLAQHLRDFEFRLEELGGIPG